MIINLISDVPSNFKNRITKEKDKDTLNYWYTPFKADSLNFEISNSNFIDTITIKLRKKNIDSLVIDKTIGKELNYRDTD